MRSAPALLAVATGLLFALASPGYGFSPLAWVALVPLYRALDDASIRRAAFLGWVAGVVFATLTLYWIARPLLEHTTLGIGSALALTMAVVAVYAVPFALFSASIAFVEHRRGGLGMPVSIVAWPTLEWVRSVGPLPLPWGLLGYTQPTITAASQLAEWTGVYGVGALVVAVNGAVTLGLWPRRRSSRTMLLATTAIVALCLIFGAWRRLTFASDVGDEISVGLIQTDLAARRRWSAAEQAAAVESALDLARRAAHAGADLVVWPESAAPIVLGEDEIYERFAGELEIDRELRDRIRALAREIDRPLVVSAAGRAPDVLGRGDVWSARNRLSWIGADGSLGAVYDKRILVPVGEVMPSLWPFSEFAALTSPDLALLPGGGPKSFALPSGRMAPLICWEAIFPAFVAEASAGAGLLVNVTNDIWFGASIAAEQHLAMAAFRAVENRMPLVRAANGGISAIVAADGRIVERTLAGEVAWIVQTVRLGATPTFYARFGDLFVAGTALATLVLLMYAGRLTPALRDEVETADGGDE